MAFADMIGRKWPDRTILVEAGALRFFAKASGETNPVYIDEVAARAAGHPGLPVPPTFLFSLDVIAPAETFWLEDLALPLEKILHAEQSFTYDRMVYVGERLRIASRISEAYEKKGGLLQFLTRENRFSGEDGSRVALLKTTLVVRHG